MDRIRKTLILFGIFAIPAAAQTYFAGSQGPCFTAGTSTFQMSSTAFSPDYRVKIDGHVARPDLRMHLVDTPETADFVLVDDFSSVEGNACKAWTAVKTIKVDSEASSPDLTISLSNQAPGTDDFKLYVHSARFSHQDAAALFAVMWKLNKSREVAGRY
jgi:hypothetical protein